MAEVSIIIPTKSRPKLLERAVYSVLKQNYKNWELFIINDSEIKISNDFSDPRIQITNNNNQPGANGARNTGINLAKGKYIAFTTGTNLSLCQLHTGADPPSSSIPSFDI